ncbi:MAG: hypothetical protein COZ18_05975 [Flexibacter sp. CG_4_10_14_3_um_filter_32_15]|nr:MAG: hypothetical protein COZ18_05975 [Flexibacter sp. CG_4_10_14_3_um_filter_32_15]
MIFYLVTFFIKNTKIKCWLLIEIVKTRFLSFFIKILTIQSFENIYFCQFRNLTLSKTFKL